MQSETKQKILKRRAEIEEEITELLKETDSNFTLEDVKEVIFNEEGQDDLTDAIRMFDNGLDASDLSNVLETLTDAWNYFPHKALNGLSPAEKKLEYHQ